MEKYKRMTGPEGVFYYGLAILGLCLLELYNMDTIYYLLLTAYLFSIELIVTKIKTNNFNKKSKVVSIEDTKFLITEKYTYRLKREFNFRYYIKLKNIEDETLCPKIESKTIYEVYNIGENITLQKVVYKYKNKYICEFKRAEKTEYKKLKKVSEEDLKDYELIGKDMIEKYCKEIYCRDSLIKQLPYLILILAGTFILNAISNAL